MQKEIVGLTTFHGSEPGKTVAIMAGVHGDEPCGLRALEALAKDLIVKRGTVHFLIGNPEAIKLNRRQFEWNLNRAFRPDIVENSLTSYQRKSYERKRALEIMEVLKECDALLDIHSSMSIESTPFIICEKSAFPIARRLPFSILSFGWDEIEPGGTDYFMSAHGKIGICIECGCHLDSSAPAIAEKSARTFLTLMGSIDGDIPPVTKKRLIDAYRVYHPSGDFVPAKEFADFAPLSTGELIGMDGRIPIYAGKDEVIIFCRKCNKPDDEAFILGREIFGYLRD
ncbi:MAG TPA: succinylglutamate desuccinylase/aspartoacylase family protein [Candidatus Paceibacterota bacterium]|nr:succinylglutamate desuccinylase/aspartoacylase family protein [Candidatus Paceibacterota bacterium]